MLKRILRGLEHFKARESNPEVASMMNMQSEIDAGKISGSYTLVKVFLWAIPIMGFIGTVLGISTAIAGLAGGLGEMGGDMDRLMDQLTNVTVGLGVAFDTTLVALCMSIVLSFPASSMQKAEEDLLAEVDGYCLENLLKRLSDAGGVSDVAGNTRSLVNALAPALAENQQDLLKELRDVGAGMAAGQARQLELVERTTAAIEAQRAAIEAKVGGDGGEPGSGVQAHAGEDLAAGGSLLPGPRGRDERAQQGPARAQRQAGQDREEAPVVRVGIGGGSVGVMEYLSVGLRHG